MHRPDRSDEDPSDRGDAEAGDAAVGPPGADGAHPDDEGWVEV